MLDKSTGRNQLQHEIRIGLGLEYLLLGEVFDYTPIKLNLQYQFHKLLMVYVSPEVQVERLAKRDGITKEEAAEEIINAIRQVLDGKIYLSAHLAKKFPRKTLERIRAGDLDDSVWQY